MTDLSKFSADQLADMKLDALRLRLNYIVMANSCGAVVDHITKEIERRKAQEKPL